MRKPFRFNELSPVKCSCGKQLKLNVVLRKTSGPLKCFRCWVVEQWEKGHETRAGEKLKLKMKLDGLGVNVKNLKIKKWTGAIPQKCDFCEKQLNKEDFIDGKTARFGSWGIMCTDCHSTQGIGLGVGKGQRYNEEGIKIAG